MTSEKVQKTAKNFRSFFEPLLTCFDILDLLLDYVSPYAVPVCIFELLLLSPGISRYEVVNPAIFE